MFGAATKWGMSKGEAIAGIVVAGTGSYFLNDEVTYNMCETDLDKKFNEGKINREDFKRNRGKNAFDDRDSHVDGLDHTDDPEEIKENEKIARRAHEMLH